MAGIDAISEAVDWAIKENLLDGFFKEQKEEILAMSLTEFDAEEVTRDLLEEGREIGVQEKAEKDAIEFLKEGDSPEKIARCIRLPLEKVLELQKSITVEV